MRAILVALIALSLGLAGCTGTGNDDGMSDDGMSDDGMSDGSSSSSSSSDPSMSSASIYVKDAPTDEFSEIHVVFTKVEVHQAGGDDDDAEEESEEEESEEEESDSDNETADDGNLTTDSTHEDDGNETADGGNETEDEDESEEEDESDDDSSWITLFESEEGVDIDLLAASGDAAAFLGEADLAAGKYTQIRIQVESAYGVSLDGNSTVNITVSSGTLKINHPFDVEEGSESQITVDYDLNKSLKETGQGWRMTPVVGSVVVDHVPDEKSGEDVDAEGEIDSHEEDESAEEEEEESEEEEEDESGSDNETAEDDNVTA